MANKKISELPIVIDNIYKLSDNDVVAMVSASTTAQITIKTLRDKITEFAAKTGSANTFTGNQIVNGSVVITGKLTVNDIETIYQTSSVVFSSGSNKFGDQSSDKHEFTGSIVMTGSLVVNGDSVNIGTLNSFTSSQLGVNVGNSIVTASFNSFSSSQLGVNVGNSIVTASFNSFTSSQLGVNVGVSIVTASFNSFTSSQLGVNVGVSIVTASFNEHSRSINERVADIQFYTSSVKVEIGQILAYTASVNTFTASGKVDVANIQAYTASVKEEISQTLAYTASVKETISQTLAYTASVKETISQTLAYTASVKNEVANIQAYTASVKNEVANIQAYTASVKETISQTLAYTASVKNEVANIQAYTASVKTEIGQIVSYTSSLNSYTQSVKIDISNIQSYTASVKNEVANIQAYTASVKTEIGQIVSYTSSLNSYTQSVKNEVANIQVYTSSVKFEIGEVLAYTASVKETISQTLAYTASVKNEVANIQAYTASLKAAAIVSSSTQITNYYKFAETASANTFYGTQTINGNLQLSSTSPLVYNAGNTNAMLFGFFDGSSIYGPYYQIFGSNYSNTTQRGSAEFVFDSRNGGYTGFNIAEFNGSTWLRKFRVSPSGAEVTGSFVVDGGITGSLMATNNVVSSSQQVQNYFTFAKTGSANTFYGTQTLTDNLQLGGRMGIDVSTPDIYTKLHIADTTNGFVGIRLSGSGDYTGTDWTLYASTNLAPSSNDFFGIYNNATTDGATAEYKFKVHKAGDVTITNGNLEIGTSGKGIDFSITTNGSGTTSSELLNDYEEGTWSPVITDLTNDATMDGTYTRGTYTKIGRQVTVRGYILTTSLGSVTGNVKIKGLPFTNGSGFGSLGGGSIGTASGLNITAGHSVHISTPLGQNHLGLNVGDDAAGTTEMTAAEWSADGQVQMLATYFVD